MERVKNPNTNISSIAPLSVHLRNHSVLRNFFQPAKTDDSRVNIFSVYRKESEEFDEDWTKIRNEDFNTPVFVSLLLWSFRDGWNSVAHSTPVSRVSTPCSRGPPYRTVVHALPSLSLFLPFPCDLSNSWRQGAPCIHIVRRRLLRYDYPFPVRYSTSAHTKRLCHLSSESCSVSLSLRPACRHPLPTCPANPLNRWTTHPASRSPVSTHNNMR